jgi:hypothetical protein
VRRFCSETFAVRRFLLGSSAVSKISRQVGMLKRRCMSTSYSNTLALSRLHREKDHGAHSTVPISSWSNMGRTVRPSDRRYSALKESQDPWHGVKRSNVEATQPLSAPPKALDLREAIPARGDRLQLEIAHFRGPVSPPRKVVRLATVGHSPTSPLFSRSIEPRPQQQQ